MEGWPEWGRRQTFAGPFARPLTPPADYGRGDPRAPPNSPAPATYGTVISGYSQQPSHGVGAPLPVAYPPPSSSVGARPGMWEGQPRKLGDGEEREVHWTDTTKSTPAVNPEVASPNRMGESRFEPHASASGVPGGPPAAAAAATSASTIPSYDREGRQQEAAVHGGHQQAEPVREAVSMRESAVEGRDYRREQGQPLPPPPPYKESF